eukprot:TRINITY_DN2822_c0_g1_i2.p1 TRINITY_DN2822_c0_g1~~TRINITY_DN2822_c0_g1_i2.p1  ORF type:complete len:892 (+),score=162.04 TRINITY_DN2822_c0_g1_i2:820-3495(+)
MSSCHHNFTQLNAKIALFVERRSQENARQSGHGRVAALVTEDQTRFVHRMLQELDDLNYASTVTSLLEKLKHRFQDAVPSVTLLRRDLMDQLKHMNKLESATFEELSSGAMKTLHDITVQLDPVIQRLDELPHGTDDDDFLGVYSQCQKQFQELEAEATTLMVRDISTNTDKWSFTDDLDNTHNQLLTRLETIKTDQELMKYLIVEMGRKGQPGHYPPAKYLSNDDSDVVSLKSLRAVEAKLQDTTRELKVAQNMNARYRDRLTKLGVKLGNTPRTRRRAEKTSPKDPNGKEKEPEPEKPWMSEPMYLALTERVALAEDAYADLKKEYDEYVSAHPIVDSGEKYTTAHTAVKETRTRGTNTSTISTGSEGSFPDHSATQESLDEVKAEYQAQLMQQQESQRSEQIAAIARVKEEEKAMYESLLAKQRNDDQAKFNERLNTMKEQEKARFASQIEQLEQRLAEAMRMNQYQSYPPTGSPSPRQRATTVDGKPHQGSGSGQVGVLSQAALKELQNRTGANGSYGVAERISTGSIQSKQAVPSESSGKPVAATSPSKLPATPNKPSTRTDSSSQSLSPVKGNPAHQRQQDNLKWELKLKEQRSADQARFDAILTKQREEDQAKYKQSLQRQQEEANNQLKKQREEDKAKFEAQILQLTKELNRAASESMSKPPTRDSKSSSRRGDHLPTLSSSLSNDEMRRPSSGQSEERAKFRSLLAKQKADDRRKFEMALAKQRQEDKVSFRQLLAKQREQDKQTFQAGFQKVRKEDREAFEEELAQQKETFNTKLAILQKRITQLQKSSQQDAKALRDQIQKEMAIKMKVQLANQRAKDTATFQASFNKIREEEQAAFEEELEEELSELKKTYEAKIADLKAHYEKLLEKSKVSSQAPGPA